MHGMPIRIRIDGNGLDPEAAGRANDAARNFATVMIVDWVSYESLSSIYRYNGVGRESSSRSSLTDPARSVEPTHRFAIRILSKRGFF